jgi:hypothetical protein
MKRLYHLLPAAMLLAVAWPQEAASQAYTVCPTTQNACVVEWGTPQGEPIINALRNTIANDTNRPVGRIYVLKRGGFYYNEDRITNNNWHLRLIGQTAAEGAASGENVCGPGGNEDCGPALIQRMRREDGEIDPLMIESGGDGNGGFTLRNLWLMGQDNTGAIDAYEPITVNSQNSMFEIDDVVFDRNEWHHLGFKRSGNRIHIRNSVFRNLTGDDQIWSGRVIRLEGGAEELVFENNTMFNVTSFPVQSEAAPIEYFVFNHNTVVNFGRTFNAGGAWQRAYVANNLFINPFWQGESQAQYTERRTNWTNAGNTLATFPEHIGIFGIGSLPAAYGFEEDRRIVLANNAWWRDPAVEAHYARHGNRAQPLVSDTTAGYFARYEGMVMQGNVNLNPGFQNAPTTAEVYAQMGGFIDHWIGNLPDPWPLLYWDPGRPAPGHPDHPTWINWPLPEDFSYTNAALRTSGTDGLPLGDLNWFPDAKATYTANREQYLQQIEDLAGAAPETPTASRQLEAEAGTFEGGEIQYVEGQTWYVLTDGQAMNWTFTLEEEKEYCLDFHVNMAGRDMSGVDKLVNGRAIFDERGWGQFVYEPSLYGMPNNEWITKRWCQEDLNVNSAGALTLNAGENTVRVQHSWAQNTMWAGFDVIDPATGEAVVSLGAPQAVPEGVAPRCGDDVEFCASGFQWVALEAGGRLTWTINVPEGNASMLLRLFYRAPSGAMGALHHAGGEQPLLFTAATELTDVMTTRFDVQPGNNQVSVSTTSGGLDLDYALVLFYAGGGTSAEPSRLPEGYALDQNYPNPFNGATTIRYELGGASPVRLQVYDVLGRRVATLVDEVQPAGPYTVRLDANGLASGTYFYRIETAVGQEVRRMTVIR